MLSRDDLENIHSVLKKLRHEFVVSHNLRVTDLAEDIIQHRMVTKGEAREMYEWMTDFSDAISDIDYLIRDLKLEAA